MTYSQFLIICLGLPLVFCVSLSGIRRHITPRLLLTLVAVSIMALVYTGPWDNLIIVNGVWSYGPRQVFGIVLGHVPVEEYVFYILQVFFTGLLTAYLVGKRSLR